MRKLILLICFLFPVLAFAVPNSKPEIRPDAPDMYVVVKGDTLWAITGKFFSKPWKWPYVWGMNKDHIKNPHWIYPGDIVYLDRKTGTLGFGKPSPNDVDKLTPKIREEASEHDAIPSISGKALAPFLSQPLVIEEGALAGAPVLIGAREGRVLLAVNDTGFVKGLSEGQGVKWQLFRPGKKFIDPDSKEVLGVEAIYLGDADATQVADVSTIKIKRAVQEIYPGDRLVAPSGELLTNYLPRAPENNVSASVISIYGGVEQGGQNSIVTLNKGERDGLQVGHVLALFRKGETIKHEGKPVALPDEEYGLLFVFRTFNKVSYALVMQTRLPVQLLDHVKNP